jgi:RNA polymerase sigma factor (sigma-70 family)
MDRWAGLSDAEVVAAVEGGRAATDHVAREMAERVRLMAFARLKPSGRDLAALEDITQESLHALIAGLPTLKLPTVAGLRSFASTIVSRRVADHLRDPVGAGRARKPPASLDSTVVGLSSAGPLWQFLSGSAVSPLSAAAREGDLERVMQELGRLREEYRAVITMAFFDQLSTAQIAEQTGSTRQAAAMMLLRAVRALRGRVCGQEAAESDDHDRAA